MTKPASKKKPPAKKKVTFNHGGKKIEVPILSGPVGQPNAALQAKYPVMNAPADVAIVDHYLDQLRAIKSIRGPEQRHPFVEWIQRLLQGADEKTLYDRTTAIACIQKNLGILDKEEVQYQIVTPDGPTLKALVDYGDMAEQLSKLKQSGRDYTFYGAFNKEVLKTEITTFFNKHSKVQSKDLIPAVLKLIGFMENDKRIIDIRWMAYMLATVLRETTHTVTEEVLAFDKKGNPIKDKAGKQVMKRTKRFMAMTPVDEGGHGHGRKYYLPVKVRRMADGTVTVAEMDGDQFVVGTDGRFKATNTGAIRGTNPNTQATSSYVQEMGKELKYFGRGFVQLTWWDNYAAAGVALGHGLEFLLDPEMVKKPEISYEIMAHGMLTGYGFANGHRFSEYFYGTTSDYVGARRMVNGTDHAQEIADNALKFEAILLRSAIR